MIFVSFVRVDLIERQQEMQDAECRGSRFSSGRRDLVPTPRSVSSVR
jgi:hypothetical protein